MLYLINNYIQENIPAAVDSKEFWSYASSEAVEEFLQSYVIPDKLNTMANGYTETMVQELEDHIISTDDATGFNLLDSVDVKVATIIVLIKVCTDSVFVTSQNQ